MNGISTYKKTYTCYYANDMHEIKIQWTEVRQ
jgi:hypothetical protein